MQPLVWMGLQFSFYLLFWDKLGDLLFQSLNFSAQEGCLSPTQRKGIRHLITKKDKNLALVQNWRPITLLNVDYKILSKTLAMRLALELPKLIGIDQRGFIKGWYIGENVFELYSIIAQAESDKEEGVLLQLDIEKAFDSVSWNYLYEVLSNFNFPGSYIDWIKILYCQKELQIINNGRFSEKIFP